MYLLGLLLLYKHVLTLKMPMARPCWKTVSVFRSPMLSNGNINCWMTKNTIRGMPFSSFNRHTIQCWQSREAFHYIAADVQ